MNRWQKLLKQSITTADELGRIFPIDTRTVDKITASYPMRLNPYYLSLIEKPGDPIWLQAIPQPEETTDAVCFEDPLNEEELSPVPNLIHKYPDRALFLVHSQCAVYCRFCTRKRKVGQRSMLITDQTIKAGIDYINRTRQIRDVLISGGDPLLLPDSRIEAILSALRRIRHVEIIRLGTRVPCTLPQRVTNRLAAMLKKYHPLYINTHFNHPREVTPAAASACTKLADAGIPLGCQTVLLRGVNDDFRIIKSLMHKLLTIRVKPYYLFQADMTRGTNHFRTPVEKGLEIVKSLVGHTSGLAIPTLAVDAPGGGGKIPLTPDFDVRLGPSMTFTNYRGLMCTYHNG